MEHLLAFCLKKQKHLKKMCLSLEIYEESNPKVFLFFFKENETKDGKETVF